VVRGHEFHYATLTSCGADPALAEMTDAQGKSLGAAGGWRGHVSGAFFHIIAQVL
jgi:cobyrinic acid a,c-diamide synthase